MTHSQTVAQLVQAAADFTGCDPKAIIGKRRTMELCEARWACWIVLRAKGWPLQSIASGFKRHHSTVIWGLNQAADNTNPHFREICDAVKSASEKPFLEKTI